MLLSNHLSALLRNISNVPGWSSRNRYVVIESDDWGSIRMPSGEVFARLLQAGINFYADEGLRFNENDSLATADDLASLFELLSSFRDSTGRPPVITPVSLVANPDFGRIRESGFAEYYYEPFPETLKRYRGCEESFRLWQDGIKNRLFVPQFHGREHLNVMVWLRALQQGHNNAILAFDNHMWGISTASDPAIGVEFQAAFDLINPDDIEYQRSVIISGLDLFEELFGYRAAYFVPPNGPFSSKLESSCEEAGLKFLSVSKIRKEPTGFGRTQTSYNWFGKRSSSGLILLTRNCFFEPGSSGHDWVDECMFEISAAFRWNKPAIVSSHRVNYIGALNRSNRDLGLRQLGILLKRIIKTWPDVMFVTSAELGEIIANG